MSHILTGSQVMQVLDMDLALSSAQEAFMAYGEGRVNMPPKAYLTLAQGDFRAMYGEIFLPRDHICGLKWVNVHPGNPARGLLTVMAKIILNDPDTGLEFADLDGTHITDYRTGAAGGVAARYLARSDATRLGLIGAGAQARTQVAAILKVRSIQEIVVFDRHQTINAGLQQANFRTILYYAVFFPTVELIGAISLALIIGYGGGQVMAGALTFGVLVAFIQYAEMFYGPIRDLSEKYNILQGAMASSERIFTLLDTTTEILVPDQPQMIGAMKGKVEFDHVWFAYKGEEWVLQDLSLSIQPGEKIALVGATGAGKTSIASLLNRFYEFQKGSILLDDLDLRRWDAAELRRRIGLVLQDVFLFTGTIADNIRLGDTRITTEMVRAAAREVGADTFIERLPGGYDHKIGERGTGLSFGEKQLLAFARTLAFNPPLLILDEATSSVDTGIEILIQRALARLLAGRTAIVIAHRLSTIRAVDRIVVLHKGRVREIGTHEELLQQKGIYYRLYLLQYKDQDAGTREMNR